MKKQKNLIGKRIDHWINKKLRQRLLKFNFMNKKFSIFLTISFLVFLISGKTIAGTGDNVSGWAWSENVGWISFNCYNDYNGDGALEDHCSSSNYGVRINPSTKVFSGYTWSENIGWITFNESELSECPVSPCRAWFDPSNNVHDWARAYRAKGSQGQILSALGSFPQVAPGLAITFLLPFWGEIKPR